MAAADHYGAPERFDAPAYRGVAVTPADATDLAVVSRGVYVGGEGDLVVVFAGNGEEVTLAGVPAGSLLPVAVSRIKDTGTTATNIVALY